MASDSRVPEELVGQRLITTSALRAVLGGKSRRTICKMIKAGVLPKPTKFGGGNHWRVSVIHAWLEKYFGPEAVAALEQVAA